MLDYHQILNEMYPVPNGELIEGKNPLFSLVNHATDKYVVNPRVNCLHAMGALATYWFIMAHKDLIPIKAILNLTSPETKMYGLGTIISTLVPFGLLYIGNRAMKSVPEHEASHAYRMRYHNFMKSLKIKKTTMGDGKKIEEIKQYGPESNNFDSKYLSMIDHLENMAKDDSIKAIIARELAVVLSFPYLLKNWKRRKEGYTAGIDEDLAKFDAVWASGIRVNDVSRKTEKKFRSLAFRTDIGKYVPLNTVERIEEKTNSSNLSEKDKKAMLELQKLEIDDVNESPGFKFYLEHPPVIIPKYSILKTLLRQLVK